MISKESGQAKLDTRNNSTTQRGARRPVDDLNARKSTKDVHKRLLRYSLEFLEGMGTPVALATWLRLKHGEYSQLVEKKIDPADYTSADSFRADYAAVSLLRKYPGFKLDVSTRDRAIEKFWEAETQCARTNDFLRRLRLGENSSENCSYANSIIYRASRKIQTVLGDVTGRVFEHCDFGPGATSHATGMEVSKYNKFDIFGGVSHRALHHAISVVASCPQWTKHVTGITAVGPFSPLPGWFDIEDCNRVTFVPKDAQTDRAIAIEPHLNIFLQKGVGQFMRRRLVRAAGQDLSDQTVNQRFARQGSIDGSLATIDLSSASDTISVELVRALMTDEWFDLLDSLRSHYFELDGEVFRASKFSSMGNGFTFELESLIFWAICSATLDHFNLEGIVNVYGDDIVVPTEAYDHVLRSLEILGFTPNPNKSFCSGPFRESCGKDYYNGIDVRPFFLKVPPHNVQALYVIANATRRLASRFGHNSYCDRRLLPSYRVVRSWIPKHLECLGPMELGDTVISVNLDEATPPRHRCWDGWLVRALVTKPTRGQFRDIGPALCHTLERDFGRAEEAKLGKQSVEQILALHLPVRRRLVLSTTTDHDNKLPSRGAYDHRGTSTVKITTKGFVPSESWTNYGDWLN